MPLVFTSKDIASTHCMALRLFQELYYMAHYKNLASILEHGILSHTLVNKANVEHVDISLAGAQQWRRGLEPVFFHSIHDYVPLYFNPRNPMLYSRREQQRNLVILCISTEVLSSGTKILFTDGNAACKSTQFSTSTDVVQPAVPVLEAPSWNQFSEGRRMRCAETLVLHDVPPKFIEKVVCNNTLLALHLKNQHDINVTIDPSFFF